MIDRFTLLLMSAGGDEPRVHLAWRAHCGDESGMIESMSEDLDHRQYMPVWSNPVIDNPGLAVENPQVPMTHDYAVFRAAAPTEE